MVVESESRPAPPRSWIPAAITPLGDPDGVDVDTNAARRTIGAVVGVETRGEPERRHHTDTNMFV